MNQLVNICVRNDHGYVPLVNTYRSLTHSWLITVFVTRLTRRLSLVEQELLTLPEHLSSPPAFSGVCVIRSLVLCVCFVDRCLSFFFWPLCCLFFFDLRILITSLVSSNFSFRQSLNHFLLTNLIIIGPFTCSHVLICWGNPITG
jgi:hypothetical protein